MCGGAWGVGERGTVVCALQRQAGRFKEVKVMRNGLRWLVCFPLYVLLRSGPAAALVCVHPWSDMVHGSSYHQTL